MIWNCRDKKIECRERTQIMGIVNVTPDSFSDGGKWNSAEAAVNHALELVEQGADIIDLGAQSTRPGYTEISSHEEIKRLEPVLLQLRAKTDVPISIDTYFPQVAEQCLAYGADIINDVSGAVSCEMAEIVKSYDAGWVIMHNGSGGAAEVGSFFHAALTKCMEFGIHKTHICFDMGIGFGKTRQQDRELIANIDKYRLQDIPVLLGTSRKRVIGEGSRQPIASERVYGNISADTVAVLGGANIIRLHDVKNEIQGIYMAEKLKGAIIDG